MTSLSGSYGESNQNSNTQQSGTSNTASNSTTTPLNSSQITGALGQAQDIYNSGTPTATAGLSGVNSAATDTSGLYGAANPSLTNTLNGSMLSSQNPDFQAMLTQTLQGLQPTIDGQFEQNGRYGSGAADNAWASAATNAATNLGYQNYTNERNLQTTAQQSLPSYTAGEMAAPTTQLNAAYVPIQQLIQALAAISPGQSTAATSNSATTGISNTQGNASGWNVGASYSAGSGGSGAM